MRKILTVGLVAAVLGLLAADEATARGRKCRSCCYDCCYSCGPVCSPCPGGVCPMPKAVHHHASATLVVSLPADARLTIDGNQTVSTTAQRTFYTPELEGGQTFHYTLRAEITRGDRVQTVTQVVDVRAGETTPVTLQIPASEVAAR